MEHVFPGQYISPGHVALASAVFSFLGPVLQQVGPLRQRQVWAPRDPGAAAASRDPGAFNENSGGRQATPALALSVVLGVGDSGKLV